jgi:hypothetical protein
VNVARGSVVDEDALIAALKDGRLGMAALDVFETEPTPAERWKGVPNTVLTPHMAGGTLESIPLMVGQTIENLRRFYSFYGDGLKIECPTGSGVMLTLDEIADELCRRVLKLFLRGADSRRPVFGGYEKFQTDPHFKDYILFHEYFHGDNGRGCGASHQTGWTGLVANLISQLAQENAAHVTRTEPVAAEPVQG